MCQTPHLSPHIHAYIFFTHTRKHLQSHILSHTHKITHSRTYIHAYLFTYTCEVNHAKHILHTCTHMGWLRSVGSIELYVSFAEYRLFYRALLQKRLLSYRSYQYIFMNIHGRTSTCAKHILHTYAHT